MEPPRPGPEPPKGFGRPRGWRLGFVSNMAGLGALVGIPTPNAGPGSEVGVGALVSEGSFHLDFLKNHKIC